MSRPEMDRLLADLQTHPHLLTELRSLAADPDRVAFWAQDKGYDLTPQEVKELAASDQELSDDDLEQVAGGEEDWTPGGTGTGGGGTGTGTGGTGTP